MFKLLKNNDGANAGYTERVAVSAGTYAAGVILTAAGAKATGNAVGAYVNIQSNEVVAEGGSLIATVITDGMVFEVKKPTGAITVGSSYKFSTTGDGIVGGTDGATATGGALVLAIDGDKCRVRINK